MLQKQNKQSPLCLNVLGDDLLFGGRYGNHSASIISHCLVEQVVVREWSCRADSHQWECGEKGLWLQVPWGVQ